MLHEDRISELPSDILISIISRLTLKEATSTCILSTRWKHLHTYVSHLNFPKYRDWIDTESNYASMINHVLDSHRGTQIKELVVDMSIPNCDNFERWFEFAITKKAEIIRLHVPFLNKGTIHGEFHNKGPVLRVPITNGIKCLKDLYLCRSIKMTDQDFEILISNCLALECLRIEVSINLKNISIVGHSKLKHVTLSKAREVESIVISDAINLISLTFYNLTIRCAIKLSSIPKLTKLNFQETFDLLMLAELLVRIPPCIRDQLQLLRLSTTFDSYSYMSWEDLDHPELLWVDLVNIKHLELVIETNDSLPSDGSFQCYVRRLIEVCGSLEKLVIKFIHQTRRVMCEWCREEMDIDQPAAECRGCRYSKIIGYFDRVLGIYQHAKLPVKYLEITGYFGSSWQRKLALYVVSNAEALQKFTVVSCDQETLARARRDFRHAPSVHYDTGSCFSGRPELYSYKIDYKWCSD